MPVSADSEANPLLDGLRIEPTPSSTALVIFGASGDLTKRKLLPAVYRLARNQRLPARFVVIGVARSPMTDEEFRQLFHGSLKEFADLAKPDDVSSTLAETMSYVHGELDDPALYQAIAAKLPGMTFPADYHAELVAPTQYGNVLAGTAAGNQLSPNGASGGTSRTALPARAARAAHTPAAWPVAIAIGMTR